MAKSYSVWLSEQDTYTPADMCIKVLRGTWKSSLHLRCHGLGGRRKHRDCAGLLEAHQTMPPFEGGGAVLLRAPLLNDGLGFPERSSPLLGYAVG